MGEDMVLRRKRLPSGKITFEIDDFHNGVRHRESLGVVIPPKADPLNIKNLTRLAETLFAKRQAEILLARKGLLKDENPTLVSYGKSLAENRNQADHVVKVIPYLEKHFGQLELKGVDYRAADAFQAFLSKSGLAPKTVKHYFAAFAFIMNEAVRDRYLEDNPAKAVRRVKVPEKVVAALTDEELAALWKTPLHPGLGEAVKQAFFLSVNTGLRMSDIRDLSSKDVTIEKDGWKLIKSQSKTGALVSTPLNTDAVEILKPRYKLGSESPIFPELQTKADYTRYVRAWVQKAGIKRTISFHTARHTFGTNLARLGSNALQIKAMMGHTTGKMTEHYTQSAGNAARELVDKLPKVQGAKNA